MKLLIAGDFCPQERIAKNLDNRVYEIVTDKIKSHIKSADYSIVNFETTIKTDSSTPILKTGPCLYTTENAVEAVKEVGFSCVTLANNHFRDFGAESCLKTIYELNKFGIDYVGGGANLEEATKILYKSIREFNIAIINACEHEFSIATEISAGSAPLDFIDVTSAIQIAKRQSDFVILIIHGGHEYYQLPSPRMKKLYRFFIDQGADAVINHHQHCYSGYEVYNNRPIFYGLGNFCFDGNRSGGKDIWYEGYMVCLNLDGQHVNFEITPYIQCKENPVIRQMTEIESDHFLSKITALNNIISNDDLLYQSFVNWCQSRDGELRLILTPYNKRVTKALWRRGFLPSFFNANRMISLYGKLMCESHKDTLEYTIKKLTTI